MTPNEATDDIESTAASTRTAVSSRTSFLRSKWCRASLIAAVTVCAFAATLLVAYELALARVPQHRAALERLVRSQTGLDVRFNELGLRWGWYGPEAVFQRVELGEPGNSSVLLRAPQLIVGFDAWRTMQSGQLAAGRITLIAPDIDLERLNGRGRAPRNSSAAVAATDSLASRARILERWRGGRIDIEGGTLRLPDPGGASNPLTLQIRRAALRHSDDEWNGYGLVFLPERLGRMARVVVELRGDLHLPQSLNGGLRFEGRRLAFSGWREVLGAMPALVRNLPATGGGDVTVNLTLKNGRIEKSDGQVVADRVTFGAPPWVEASEPAHIQSAALSLDYLGGEWRFVRRAHGGQVQIEQLVLSRAEKGAPLPRIAIEIGAGHIHGTMARASLRSAMPVAQWLAPEMIPTGLDLKGSAEDVDFDWNAARPEGQRLAASARVDAAVIASTSGSFNLSGLDARLSGTENRVAIELNAPAARLVMAAVPGQPLEHIHIASVLQMDRTDTGWNLATPAVTVNHEAAHLVLSGELAGNGSGDSPVVNARGTVARADIATLQQLFAASMPRAFGAVAARLTGGHVENGKFELRGSLDTLFGGASTAPVETTAIDAANGASSVFTGSLELREARVAAEGAWPATEALDAQLEWNGPRVRVSVDEGRAGPFELDSVEAQWDTSGKRASHVTGRARTRVEQALAWVRAHPQLQEHAPHLQGLVARGDALLDFDVSIPADTKLAPRAAPPRTRAHVAAVLEDVQFQLAPELPPVESLRGSLAFDAGHLQRSTLTATWLGGPLTLKVSERRDRRGNAMAVQAQGFIEAGKLVALSQIKNLPEVTGETPWTGELLYTAPTDSAPARWQGRADSNLLGIASELPAPLAKLAGASVPLHVEISGSGDTSDVRATLADRMRTAFTLRLREDSDWQIERGTVRLAGGTNASVQANRALRGMDLRIESGTFGVVTGTLQPDAHELAFTDLKLTKQALQGEGSVHCTADLATCVGKFELTSDDTAATLADLGFRPELSAAKGSLSGALTWSPRLERPWLESATGELDMRFDDGVARHPEAASGRPFPLLTVPALLSGIARPDGAPPGELRFKRLDAQFQLRDGEAYTSDLHFDGDAEILVRGRTGLLARDYDHEAWVLRGEERIPASLRRLAAAPRVAAAWMTLRDFIRGDAADRSRIVLHMRGSWAEPVVTVD